MIIGMHAIIYSREADRLRAFIDEVLELDSVDAGGGWPIYAAPPTELAVHETDEEPEHELYLMCDDVAEAVERLAKHGVMTAPVEDRGWGLATSVELPGGERIGLYEPRHPSPLRRRTKAARRKPARSKSRKRHKAGASPKRRKTRAARPATKKRSTRKKRR